MDPDDWEVRKKGIEKALEKFHKKNDPKPASGITYNSPEKDLEKEVLVWLRANGFHVNVIEAKAVYNRKLDRYVAQTVSPGFVDIAGNDKTGLGTFIELKAPGRRSTLRENQREFLLQKIETGCFAVCIDSVNLLESQYLRFTELRQKQQFEFSKDFLRAALPKKKDEKDDGPLFPD